MNHPDQSIRDALARYRANSLLGLMRGLGFLLVGLIGVFLAVTGSIFNTTNGAPPSGWLYDTFGAQGAQLIAVGICVLCALIGAYWVYTRYRNLTVGIQAYEAKLRAERNNRA